MDRSQRLLRHGITLFLIGLLTGLAVPAFANPRAGLAAHLEALMNGTFLLALGMAWTRFGMGPRLERAVYGLVVFGTWANWVGTTLAAAFGTSHLTPLAGAGHAGTALQENVVTAVLVSLALAMIAACGAITWTLWRPRLAPDA